MTEKSIVSIIHRLNKNPNYKNCIKHSISNNVDFAHIWIENSRLKHSPKSFFLIKKGNEYIGTVLDMETDLHWVILPKHRKNGYLINALKEVIIPYLFNIQEKEELNITINELEIGKDNYKNSSGTALKVGFKKVDDKSFVLVEKDFDFSNEKLEIKHKGLEDVEIEGICKELKAIARKVSVINSKIELSLGKQIEEYSKPSLNEIANKLAYLKGAFKDMKYDFDNK